MIAVAFLFSRVVIICSPLRWGGVFLPLLTPGAIFEREDGTTCTAELEPGKVTYIPPFWAHRSVNTSATPLVFLWTRPVDAGHDYEGLGGRGMRQIVVERDGAPSIEDRPSRQA